MHVLVRLCTHKHTHNHTSEQKDECTHTYVHTNRNHTRCYALAQEQCDIQTRAHIRTYLETQSCRYRLEKTHTRTRTGNPDIRHRSRVQHKSRYACTHALRLSSQTHAHTYTHGSTHVGTSTRQPTDTQVSEQYHGLHSNLPAIWRYAVKL